MRSSIAVSFVLLACGPAVDVPEDSASGSGTTGVVVEAGL